MYNFLRKFIYHTSAFLFLIACSIAFVQVIARFVLNSSLSWAEESIRYIFIWMFFMGAAEASRISSHVMLDLLPSYLNEKARKIWAYFIDGSVIIFLSFLIFMGTKLSLLNLTQKSAALQIPMGLVYLAVPFGCLLMLYFTAHNLVERFKNKEEV